MIVVSAKDLTKTYGTDVILDKVSFHINKGERVGIVGVNGAGKTTLLRMLTGQLSCDAGEFFISADTVTGYLEQSGGFDSSKTVFEEAEAVFSEFHAMEHEMERIAVRIEVLGEGTERRELLDRYDRLSERYMREGGYTYKSELTGMLTGMAFGKEYYDKKISTLSGGEKTRLALACLLLSKPDILFLDEPTNHLDIETLKWLEQYIKAYKGTVIMVSHDRYFLDETVTRIFEVESHKLSIYEGNYSFYAAEKRQRRESELRKYEKQRKEIERQEDMIRRFKQRGTEKLAKRAASREKRLAATELMERPGSGKPDRMKLSFRENFQSGKDVLFVEDVSKSFGYGADRRRLFENVEMDVKRGERICIVGANGIGKTTLIRMMMGELSPETGRIKIGHNVQFGYYDQGQQLLTGSNTVIGELQDAYRLYTDTELRNILGRFLFRGESVFLTVDSLSGGEKARLALLKLMLSGANVLLLDEPTNHLDIESKEVFEEALLEFPGTCIIVSHDRYFLNKIPTRIMELTECGMETYLGTYDYYVEKKQSQLKDGSRTLHDGKPSQSEKNGAESGRTTSSAEERRLKKERDAELRRIVRKKEQLESEIEQLEAEIAELEDAVGRKEIMTDYEKLTQISEELTDKRSLLEEKYDEWMMLQD